MREEDRSHGQMKTEGGKVAAFKTMPSSAFFQSFKSSHVDTSRVKEVMLDEFYGRELPPNCKLSRVRIPDSVDQRKQDPDGRRDVMVERSIWDDETLGHRVPPNYISRIRNPEGFEKKQGGSESRRGGEVTISGAYSRGSSRHTRYSNPDDTFEYNFDKTVDSYVLSEVSCGKDSELRCKSDGLSTSVIAKHEGVKVETFEERALRFGVEDWNLFGNRKWTQQSQEINKSKGGSKRSSTRRGIFHSPSGSDTSSMISTLESSSFTCGSEASSFARTDLSSSSFNLSYVYAMSGGPYPLSAIGGYPPGCSVERTGEDQFVEFDILETAEKLDSSLPQEGCTELIPNKDGSVTFFEFSFLDDKMVDSEDFEGKSTTKLIDENERSRQEEAGEERSPGGRVDQSATLKSPEDSEFFDSSHDSDWSGVSTVDHQGGHAVTRDIETIFFDEDNASSVTEDQVGDDWNGDHQFYDAESFSAPKHLILPLPTSSSESLNGQDRHVDVDCKAAAASSSALISCGHSGSASAASSAAKVSSEKRSPGKKNNSRKTRSLGSVLSHHLAFTAVPSLRYKSQPSPSGELKESPAKVTAAACIEWLWSEKEAMKPVQALRAVAEREYAERERIGSSPPVRSLDHPTTSSRGESRLFGLGKSQNHVFNSRLETPSKRVETIPLSGTSSNALKDSRESILASWAAVYGTASGGESAAAARALKRPPIPVSKVSMSATSLKHVPKAGVSPRKRSVSFGSQVGSQVAASLTKQQVPKSLAVELEVLCRPFGPVLKGVRMLPTAKRGLGRPPLFSSSLGPQVDASSSSSSITVPVTAVLKCGRLQYVVSRDGLPSYSLIMDETEEIFAAKTLRVDGGLQEGVSHVYTFHCFKGKGKGKSGWRQWGKKEKPGSDFAGNMTVTSTICPVSTSNGMQNFMESEFVLFDAKAKEIIISGPTPTNPYPRSSVSSWDTATPQRSPQQGASPSFSSPSSTYFSLPSPSGVSTPANGAAVTTIPTRQSSMPGVVPSDKSGSRVKQISRHMSLTSPLHPNRKSSSNSGGFHESSMSDSETPDDDSRGSCASLPQLQSELAAVVVRTPMEKSQAKAAPSGDKWGWGINFLRKSLDGSKSGSSLLQGVSALSNSLSSKEKSPGNSDTESSRSSTDQQLQRSSSVDEHSIGGLSITLILPSGEHGCSANGIDGPQPLIERWKSGGKCDCGSWDLGCGLTIVDNQNDSDTVDAPVKGQLRDDAMRLFLEGKKQQTVALALTPLKEGCYTLGFHAPISPLHAFATAVAVLHSRDPSMSLKKAGETKKRLTRIPVKVLPTSRSFRQTEDPSVSRSLVNYKLVCPDPPSSPFGRA